MNRRDSAWPAALAILLGGCLFELAELAPPLGGAGGGAGVSGLGGAMLGGGGGGPGGSTNGGGGNANFCPPGEAPCGVASACVPATPGNGCGDPACQSCGSFNRAVVGCDSDTRQCKVERCDEGFADCDGDTLGITPAPGANGCEYSFGIIGNASEPFVAHRKQIVLDDDSREDWSGIPAYRLQRVCLDCEESNVRPLVVAQNVAPPDADLTAYFRVAWDQAFFYVLAEAFDNRLFSAGESIDDGRCTSEDGQPEATCEDSFALFFDGRDDRGGFFNPDDHWVYLGLSGRFHAPAQGQPPGSSVAVRVLSPPVNGGARCYRMEAQFDWSYLVFGSQGSQQQVPGHFPPAENQTYGFDIAVNDWDESLSNAGVFERQSQLFFNPKPDGINYRASADGLGGLRLIGPPSGADAGALQ